MQNLTLEIAKSLATNYVMKNFFPKIAFGLSGCYYVRVGECSDNSEHKWFTEVLSTERLLFVNDRTALMTFHENYNFHNDFLIKVKANYKLTHCKVLSHP
jgi:hypothetical protein